VIGRNGTPARPMPDGQLEWMERICRILSIFVWMTTRNKILKELKNVPANRLDEAYSYIHSLTEKKETAALKDQILSFAGAFNDMDEKDYEDFVAETKNIRSTLFDREVSL